MNFEQEIEEYIRQKHYRQLNCVLVCQNNSITASRYFNGYDENTGNVIKSVAKSIMSILAGIALDKGLIESLDVPIHQWIPEFSEGRDMYHKAIRLRHLLTMTSGIYWNGGIHYHCPMMDQMRRSSNWISHIADCAVTEIPGTKYNYKEWDVILLAKVLDSVCGDLYDFLDENLYRPLDIKSKRWYQSPCGIYYSVGDGEDEGPQESRSNLTASDMLKIGQLFLHGGVYNGKQILSEQYIRQTIAPTTEDVGYGLGYGFLWWLGKDWYGCRGFGGQSITVIPKKEAIIVTQATPTSRGMDYHDVIDFCMNRL